MDITNSNWPEKVQEILTQISTACFVSLDFELSGISMKEPAPEDEDSRGSFFSRVNTLQKRYLVAKAAAEKYQILQAGITTVHETEHGKYLLRPFNINVSPILVDQAIGVNRTISLQSSSIAFLFEHGFNLQKCIADGVSYLSRYEEAQLRLKEEKSARKRAPKFRQVTGSKKLVSNTEFVQVMKNKIYTWLQDKDSKIAATNDIPLDTLELKGLNGLERQIVRQLVRQEFPDLTVETYLEALRISPNPAMQGMSARETFDREEAMERYQTLLFQSNLQRMIGLRYIMDALTKDHNLNTINPNKWVSNPSQLQRATDMLKNINQFEKVKDALKKPTVLVGHNIFVDLINFYHCFVGKLPDDVDKFAKQIHSLFPSVVDTKYLATHYNNEYDVRSSLEELDLDLQNMQYPQITLHPDHQKYDSPEGYLHEAGYDSYATARVALRLTAKMQAVEDSRANLMDEAKHKLEERTKKPSEELAELFELFPRAPRTEPVSKENTMADQAPKLAKELEGIWNKYGNHLRINGTVEEVLILK